LRKKTNSRLIERIRRQAATKPSLSQVIDSTGTPKLTDAKTRANQQIYWNIWNNRWLWTYD